jgi:hypothetical protein
MTETNVDVILRDQIKLFAGQQRAIGDHQEPGFWEALGQCR